VPEPGDGDWTAAVLERLRPEVAIAALPACRWFDGAALDSEAVGARCRETGTALVLDATQAAGAMPLDVGRIQPDFLIAAAYKWLLCPYTLAFLYAAALRQLEAWTPVAISETLRPLTEAVAAGAAERGLTVPTARHRVDHFIGLRAPRGWPDGLRQALAAENVHASLRVGTLRISPHLFSTDDDVARLFQALDRLL